MAVTTRRSVWAATVAVTTVVCSQAVAAGAVDDDAPHFQLPFACGERWEGSTRASHSPSALSIDWNRDAHDEGHLVLASAPGVVTSVTDLGDSSYGLYVVVDHGGDWTTLHAHLSAALVVAGQRVDQGQPIARVGESGNAQGAHLHYEQRLDGTDQHAVFDGESFTYGSWLRSRDCADVPVVGDWDGDGRTDVGVYGRTAAGGAFRQQVPGRGQVVTAAGRSTDSPVVGDWNGDGRSDLGWWSPTSHRFVLTLPRGERQRIRFGRTGDLPLAGDWDGDGQCDVGVFRPGKGRFLLRDAAGAVTAWRFGSAAAWPVTGDWNGDGHDDVGVYNPDTATFRLARPDGSVSTVPFGRPGSLPVTGSWHGDGRTDLGVWNPARGAFVLRLGRAGTERIRFGHPR